MNKFKFTIFKTLESLKLVFSKYPKLIIKQDYDSYWKDKRGKDLGIITNFQKSRLNTFKKEFTNNTSIKDIGCGDGGILFNLSKERKFKKMYGYDISVKTLSHIKTFKAIPKELDLNDLSSLKKLEKTDYTIILEVLEHLKNSEEILLELLKSTDKKLIFSVPNTGYFAHRLRLLFGSFPLQWRLNPSEHIRFWTYKDMRWWLKQLKLDKKSKIVLYEGIPVLNKIWPSMFTQGMVIIIKK